MKTNLTPCSKIIKAGTLLLLTWLSMFNSSMASHFVGGEINYQWVSGNTYDVRLSLYRDCSGITFASSYDLAYSSSTCGLSGFVTVTPQGSPEQVSPICGASLSNSSCNGGFLYGVEKITYAGTVTLPGNCSDWIIRYNDCCRNAAITNLVNGAGYGTYISARLNNLDVPFNNSVSFGNIPYSIISNNVTTQLSWNSYDVDGDSLVYELVPARDYNGGMPMVLPYVPGLTYDQPFFASTPTNLNFANGILEVSPNQMQVSVVCMKVSEYRNGFFVGEIYRDYQIIVENTTNTPPTLTGMNGTPNYLTNGCPGDTITFNVIGTDVNIGQILVMSMNNPSTGATFNSTPGPVVSGTFSWIPTASDISASPYTFIITINDNYCDYYGTYSEAYHVYVNGCNTTNVWPGDANSDGNANLYDLLPIGIAYNDSGPVRPSANLNWSAQPCSSWTNSFISGVNHKHADTDGDGTVTFDDTLAISQNYGLNHPLRNANPNTTSVADLTVTASADTVGLSTVVNFDFGFATPVDSIYGLAFRLYLDPNLIDLSSIMVTYPGSVFGTNLVDMIALDRSQGLNGFVDIALTRINQVNFSGTGPVARVTIVTTDNVSGKIMLYVVPTDIVGNTLNETDVPLLGVGDGVLIDPNFVGVQELDLDQQIHVFPSPAHDYFTFTYKGNSQVEYINLYDVTGNVVMEIQKPESTSTIDVTKLSKGTYFLKSQIGDNSIYKKLMVF